MSGLCWNVLSNYVNAGARDLMYSAPGPRQAETGRAGWCINTSTHQDGAAPIIDKSHRFSHHLGSVSVSFSRHKITED